MTINDYWSYIASDGFSEKQLHSGDTASRIICTISDKELNKRPPNFL